MMLMLADGSDQFSWLSDFDNVRCLTYIVVDLELLEVVISIERESIR